MKNQIGKTNPSDPVVAKLRQLEQAYSELRATQAPTAIITEASLITLPMSDTRIRLSLTADFDEVQIAQPEIALFIGDDELLVDGDEAQDILPLADRVWPDGDYFADYTNLPAWYQAAHAYHNFGNIYIALDWYLSRHFSGYITDDYPPLTGDLAAEIRLRLDSALSHTASFSMGDPDWYLHDFTVLVAWRYISPYSVPAELVE